MKAFSVCPSYRPQLSAFVDGELPRAERVSIEKHLASCSHCSAWVADLRAQSGLMRAGFELLADEVDFRAFRQGIVSKLEPARLPLFERARLSLSELVRYRPGMIVGPVAVAAAAAAVALTLATRGPGVPTGYAEARPTIQLISADADAHKAPLLLTTEAGDSIVWFVDHIHSQDASQVGAIDQKVDSQPQSGNKERPRRSGGDL